VSVDNRITLRKLEVFDAIVELGGVGKAAEAFHVAQPVVTAHLRSLEQRLGAKLVYRDGRQLSLTPAGEAVHAWAVDVLTHTRELGRHLDGLADGSRGSVSLAASMSVGSYMLPGALSDLRRERPNIAISLNIYHSDHAIRVTESGECDFAMILAESPPAGPGLTGEPLGLEPLLLVAPAGGLPPADEIDLDELAELEFVELPAGFLRRTLNEGHLAKVGLESRRIAIELGHPEAMKRAVERGLGVALMFRSSVAPELARGTLRQVRVRGWEVLVPIYLVHRRGRQFTGAQQTVIDALSAAVRNPR
jgi:LysR family transcriptional regulator, low CO2-responsive transcriptional regulator